MADTSNLTEFLQDVADAIKEKKGYQSSQKIAAANFDTEITGINTVNNQNKTVTENGSYTADSGYTGLGTVTVNVDSIPDGIFIQDSTPTKTTDEAFWLKETSASAKINLDELPDEILDLSFTDTSSVTFSIRDLVNYMTAEQKATYNSYPYHGIVISSTTGSLFACSYRPRIATYVSRTGEYYLEPYFDNGNIQVWVNSGSIYVSTTVSSSTILCRYKISDTTQTLISDAAYSYNSQAVIPNNVADYIVESGLHVDVDDKRYIAYKSGLNESFNKILDTSNANATANDILSGKTAFVNNQKLTGTMTNNGAINITPSASQQTIPAGYTSGGTVSAVDITTLSDYAVYDDITDEVLKDMVLYTRLEYIESNGGQYINTGIKPNQDTKTEMSIETINLDSTFVPFGTRANAILDYILGINFNNQNYIQYNTNTAIYSSESSSALLNTKLLVSLDGSLGRITYNDNNTDVNIDMTPTATGDFSCTTDLYLGCSNNNGTAQYNTNKYKLYYCKIYNGQTLIRDFIPVKRKSDNVICLYDKVSKTFFTNAGSGSFTAGSEVDIDEVKEKLNIILDEKTDKIIANNIKNGVTVLGVTGTHVGNGFVAPNGMKFGSNASTFTSFSFSNMDTSNMTNMSYMFNGCSGLTSLDLSNLDTSNVTNMSYMFNGCLSLTSLDLSNLDTSDVTNMSYMFSNCIRLASLDLTGFNVSKVTGMEYMFSSCKGLTSLDLSMFHTSNKLSSVSRMFMDCTNLVTLDISNLDTSSAAYTENMFGGCEKLETVTGTIDMTTVTNVNNLYNMFNKCYALEDIQIKNLSINGLSLTSCTNLSHDSLMYLINNLVAPASGARSVTIGATNKAKLTEEEIAIATAKNWTIN